jgi:hypothetical protein
VFLCKLWAYQPPASLILAANDTLMHRINPIKMSRLVALILLATTGLCFEQAKGEVTTNYIFEGNGNWSLDGAGIGQNVQIQVPLGSTVQKAFLYVSASNGLPPPPGVTPQVSFGGQTYGPANFQPLPFLPFPPYANGLEAFRADITPQITTLVGSGGSTLFNVPVDSATLAASQIDGVLLAVIYSNPNELPREIILSDGGSMGTQFAIDLNHPVNSATSGFQALFSVGIGYSANVSDQRTTISLNNRLLTAGAGGSDDGDTRGYGYLITVGGIGDDPTNPANPSVVNNANVTDDEYYNLALGNAVDPTPFITNGEQQLSFSTVNIGLNDNLFFAGLNIVVPEPSSISLAMIGLSLGAPRRFRRPIRTQQRS